MFTSRESFYNAFSYFVRSNPDPAAFQKGSSLHLFFLGLAFFLAVALIVFRKPLREPSSRKKLSLLLGVLLILEQLALYVWYIGSGTFRWYVSLPLYNCRIAAICITIALFSPWIFPRIVGCYWGLWGAMAALLLPDVDHYVFPHLTTIVFFGGHTLLLLGALYLIVIEGFLPNHSSLRNILIFTNIYHIIIYGVNHLTGGNYCYLMGPPFEWHFFEWLQHFHLYLIFVMVLFNLVMLLMHQILRWLHGKAFSASSSR